MFVGRLYRNGVVFGVSLAGQEEKEEGDERPRRRP